MISTYGIFCILLSSEEINILCVVIRMLSIELLIYYAQDIETCNWKKMFCLLVIQIYTLFAFFNKFLLSKHCK